MITRGYLIGQTIDELSALSNQILARTQLGLTDLNKYTEDFIKDILNIVFDYNLINLNEERSNNPGLDLADTAHAIGFQITSTKTSEKINKTLEKVYSNQVQYDKIIVLILQNKQTSYTLAQEYASQLNFSENDIWDINDLLKHIMTLNIDKLQKLYELIKKEIVRIKIELEIPDNEGNYQTNLNSYIEALPKEHFVGINAYYKYIINKHQDNDNSIVEDNLLRSFQEFITYLKKIPRITRQFYAMILERGEASEYADGVRINVDYLKRICNYSDMDGEIRLLEEQTLLRLDEPDERGQSAFYFTCLPAKVRELNDTIIIDLLDYIKDKNIHISKVITILDFSDFN